MTLELDEFINKIKGNIKEQLGEQVPDEKESPFDAMDEDDDSANDPWKPGDEMNDVQRLLATKGLPYSAIAKVADNPPTDEIANTYDKESTPVKSEPPKEKKKRACKLCGETGHNARTCPGKNEDKEDEDLGDPLDKMLDVSKEKAETPEPSKTPLVEHSAIGTLYVDCIPVNKEYLTLDRFFDECRSVIQEKFGVPHFSIEEYGKGKGYVSAYANQKIHDYAQGRNVYVDSNSSYVNACMDVLKVQSSSVVVGMK